MHYTFSCNDPSIKFISFQKTKKGLVSWAVIEIREGRSTMNITLWDPKPELVNWLRQLNKPETDDDCVIEESLGDPVA